ncbi:HIG1 domain family member 1A, mitochondrial isoform X2 [Aethina tumida]|uniref:HIG1 domain family member 1A, mitochondrial isoform X2 n=1 Tax=Aethina tumida TaxID=116153 RepID=UPI00096B40B2|nr:HIG1 domain family member 1A, mitochondrial isoform X2 [Aethina tumida]
MQQATMGDDKVFNFEQESQSDRLARKSKETPFFPIAIGMCTLAVGYGAYAFKNRGKMSPSVYLMHLRVGAQGAAVGSLTLGLLYTMINEHILKKKN